MVWKFREIQIEDDKGIGDSGTETIDLNVKDPITALIVRFKITNAAQACPNVPPEKSITKVEIVDGGKTLWSLNGQESVGAAVYGLGKWPSHWYAGNTSYNQHIKFPLLFGRYLGDEEFAFSPGKFLNPQLKITWAADALHLTTGKTLGVTARVMDGLAPPTQALMWKQVEAWTTVGTGVKKVDLPVDLIIRNLMVRLFETTTTPPSIVSHYKLDCDLGEFIPFDLDQDEFRDILKLADGPFTNRQMGEIASGEYVQTWLGDTYGCGGDQGSKEYITSIVTWNWHRALVHAVLHDGTAAPTLGFEYTPVGYLPHNCFLYRFGRREIPETWFPAREYGEIALKLTEAVASCDASVSVQQRVTL